MPKDFKIVYYGPLKNNDPIEKIIPKNLRKSSEGSTNEKSPEPHTNDISVIGRL